MSEFSGPNDPLTEKIIGVFYQVYNELGLVFWNLFTERLCGLL
jgi:hypothetical protein